MKKFDRLNSKITDPFRLKALADTNFLDSECEAVFDRLTALACSILSSPVSLISLVDEHRQFFKSSVGLDEKLSQLRQTPLSHSFCKHVVASGEPLVINDSRSHDMVRNNPAIQAMGVEAYLGIPLATPDRHVIGSLCVIDAQPRIWTEHEIYVLSELAGVVMTEMALRREISERQRFEKALMENEARMSAFNTHVPCFLFQRRLDEHGKIIYTPLSDNQGHFDKTMTKSQMAPDEFLGNVVHPDDIPDMVRKIEISVRDKTNLTMDCRMIDLEGKIRWLRSHASVRLLPDGKLIWDGMAFDVTELKEAQFEAERANQAKSRFLANINHDLRTPLNAIIGFSEIMEAKDAPAAIQNSAMQSNARKVREASLDLLQMIDQLLDMAAIESGEIQLTLVDCNVRDVTHKALSLVQSLADGKGLDLRVNFAPELPEKLSIDRQKLHQVLVNLLCNAVKFTNSGSVSLSVSAQAGKLDESNLSFIISDTGCGMSEAEQETLFKRFARGNNAESRTGLGLAICHELVAAMGGIIALESKPGAGSCFTFHIPAEFPQPLAVMAGMDMEARRQKRLLAVDDAQLNLKLLIDILEHRGYQVEGADSGGKALEMIDRQAYDLVLMDMRMPGFCGKQATQELRKRSDRMGRIPVIMLTADVTPRSSRECLAAGADAVLAKPIDQPLLLKTIERLIC